MSSQLIQLTISSSVFFILVAITQCEISSSLEQFPTVDLVSLKKIANVSSNTETGAGSEFGHGVGKLSSRQEVDGPATVGDWWTFIGTWSGIYTVIIIVAFGFAVFLILIWIVWSWFFYGLNGGLYSPVYGAYGRPANYNNSGRGSPAWDYFRNFDYDTIHSVLNSIEGLVDLYNDVINTSA